MGEFNRKVAELVMGWRYYSERGKAGKNPDGERVFHFGPPDYKVPDHWKNVVDDRPERHNCRVIGRGTTARVAKPEYICDTGCPSFDTEANADYSVLAFVREKWDESRFREFRAALLALFDERPGVLPDPAQYLIGDYSKAALAVVEAERKERE